MGIRGTVRRSTDSWFVHCNVDTDVIVWEGDEQGELPAAPHRSLAALLTLPTQTLRGNHPSSRRSSRTFVLALDACISGARLAPSVVAGSPSASHSPQTWTSGSPAKAQLGRRHRLTLALGRSRCLSIPRAPSTPQAWSHCSHLPKVSAGVVDSSRATELNETCRTGQLAAKVAART